MTRRPAFLIAALLLGAPCAVLADDTTLTLNVEDAVRMALAKNLDLEIERVRPQIAHEQIRAAQAEFSPLWSVAANYARNVRFLNSALEQRAPDGIIHETIVTPETGIEGKLLSGARFDATLGAPKIESDHPLRLFDTSYVPTARLTLTQPLLRGFGTEINRVRISQAVKQETQAVLGVEARMLTVIRDVETMYWEMHYAQRAEEVARENLAVADDLVLGLTRLKGAGMSTSLDVSQAQAAAAGRRADLARAEAALLNSQARLRQMIDPGLAVLTRLVASESPVEGEAPAGLEGLIDRAVGRRPEIRIQVSVLEMLALQERLAKNETLWDLEALGGVTYGGLAGRDVGPAILGPLPDSLQGQESWLDALHDGRTSWMLGLKLSIPIGNREALSGLATARQRLRQEELRLDLFKSQVSVETETAFRDLQAERALLVGSREAVDLAGRMLDAETRNLDAGRSTVRKVLEAQDNLASARIFEQRAMTNYASARSRLNAALGTSLDGYHLEVEK